MNKKDFIKLYRKKLNNLTIEEEKEDVEEILEIIEAGLKKDGKVQFFNKGVFTVGNIKPKTISNPKTRELMQTTEMKKVKFNASFKLKDKIQDKK